MAVRFGLIGCGRIAERHIRTLSRCQGAELIAVSDIQEERMNEAEHLYSTLTSESKPIHKYADYSKLLLNPDIDVIVISTLSGLHASITKQALLMNKHIVLEKPIALSLKDANDIIELAQDNGRHVLVCQQLRYRPIMCEIKQLVDSGAIGKIYLGVVTMRIQRSPEYYSAAPWRGSWAEDGGMLINQGIHFIDLLQWFLGDVQQIYGEMTRGALPKQTEDVALGILTFKNKAKGVIEANSITYPKNLDNAISLFGEKGTISIGGASFDKIYRWSIADHPETEESLEQLLQNRDEHYYMYEDLLHVLAKKKKHVLVDANEGKRAIETIFGLYQSAITRQPVPLPLPSFSTSNMAGETGWFL
ncbi:Gfo/Idh/MocA family protein [Aneurinibacillus tyrosinisolvens]|uniref:Gfo/Idh/MocA family protein n=1 Tax=Aneurinibacillus tyrosinisolvens TaxID=1443435 RepID=UPI00063F62E3|nr:Gfo/Idh/MocA family oxidoreductase [Aneurinibacillus tyrosinisolvens]